MGADQLSAVAEGVWVDHGAVSFLGLQLTSAMTVVRLGGGGLLVHSPTPLTDARRAGVDALGEVRHLYAPNTFHHLRLLDWAEAYPDAVVHGPAELMKKRKDVELGRVHGSPSAELDKDFDEVAVEGFRLFETVLFHRPSRTLILADLVHNIGRPEHGWTRMYAKMMGFYDRVALSRVIRWTSFSDRAAARRSVDAILELPFERVIVGHGQPVVTGAKQALREALAWLG